MTSLWEKINQKLHAIVDRALDAHSMALYDQYLRDVQAYRDQVETATAGMYAGVEANRRRLARHEARAADLDGQIDRLLLDGQEALARPLLEELETAQGLVATTRAQIAQQEADYRQLVAGRTETAERLEVVRGERPAVESLINTVRAGELIEQIELTLGNLAQLGGESAIGQIASRIWQRFDEAELRWQAAAARVAADQASLEAERLQVDDQLTERLRRLGLDQEE